MTRASTFSKLDFFFPPRKNLYERTKQRCGGGERSPRPRSSLCKAQKTVPSMIPSFMQLVLVKYLLYANPVLGTGEPSGEQQKQTPPLSSNSPGRETDVNQRIAQTVRNDR